ncbi:MAG: SpoIIE family protein phosphatase [Flammeovirgaceae bacterium]
MRYWTSIIEKFRRCQVVVGLMILLSCPMSLLARQSKIDTIQIKSLNHQSGLLLTKGAYTEAEKSALEAYNFSDYINYPIGKSTASLHLAKVFRHQKQYADGLKHGIYAVDLFKRLNKPALAADAHDQVAYLYEEMEIYTKAIEHFKASLALKEQLGHTKQALMLRQHIALCYEITENDIEAIRNYELALQQYQRQAPSSSQVKQVLLRLAYLTEQQQDWAKASAFNSQLLAIYEAEQDLEGRILTLNNIGVIERKGKHLKEAEAYFAQAQAITDSLEGKLDHESMITILINTSVISANLNAYTQSRKLLNRALVYAQAHGNQQQEANIYNHLSGNYYLSGINALAKDYVNKAISLGKSIDAPDVLEESYYLMYLLGMKENKEEVAEKYKALYEQLNKEGIAKRNEYRQDLLTKELEANKQEANIRGLIALQEEQARSLRQISLDNERRKKDLEIKEKELALLKSDQDLQNAALRNQKLEQERIKQRLALAEEEARTSAQRQKIELLQKDKELQELQKLEQEKELALLNAKRKSDLETIERQKQFNLGVTIILGLSGILLFVLALAYFFKRRANKQIRRQNEIIEETNLELTQKSEEVLVQNQALKQQSEEILAQRDQIKLQKEKIEESNTHIKQSIYAAEIIQTAILPTTTELGGLFSDYFIIYRPKDIVSGDFYWTYQTEKYKFIVIADCTGHGVPGAFTCMIGHAQLNDIVAIRKFYDPAAILEELHLQINRMLKQEDKNLHTGMDIALIRLEQKEEGAELTFAGAKRNLYYGLPEMNCLQTLAGNRRSIGGSSSKKLEKPFQNNVVQLPEGSIFYAFTDGYADQNNEKGKKIGTKYLVKYLEDLSDQDFAAQQVVIEKILDKHMSGVQQRDDILVAGLKI